MEVSSKYLTLESVARFRGLYALSGSGDEADVITEPVGEVEYVTHVNSQPPHYFYMYSSLIDSFNLWFPFTPFEVSMLKTMNVAPCQLTPNSWAYIKGFELLCRGLEIDQPSVVVFFSFFTIKNVSPDSPVALVSQAHHGRFHLFASNFKNYKPTFLRVRCGPNCPDIMFDSHQEPLFPFYWTSNPRVIKGTIYESLSEFEKATVAYVETLCIMSISDLLHAESSLALLEAYLSKFGCCHYCLLELSTSFSLLYVV
jgi:hypothetical protein